MTLRTTAFARARALLERAAPPADTSTLAEDARHGLARAPRSLPPKHFYDALGSRLFDRICDLPEYYLTRAERALLSARSREIATETRGRTVVELGSGMARKTGILLRAVGEAAAPAPVTYVPFDIAPEALDASARSLAALEPAVHVRGVVGEFPRDLSRLRRAVAGSDGPRLFAFLGSTIGNLDEHDAPALLRDVRGLMGEGDAFLLGVDLVKDPRTLVAAYDDAAGITAAFDKNVLTVLNRELEGDFDLRAFAHEAVWNAERSRIEMRLVSLRRQHVELRAIELAIDLEEGERILTEISRKFTRATVEDTLREGRMRLDSWYAAPDDAYALAIARGA